MNAIERIRQMEQMYDLLQGGDRHSPAARDAYAALCRYMESGEWLQDYALDESGGLPSDLKRGVLSQDGLYNLLTELDAQTNPPGSGPDTP